MNDGTAGQHILIRNIINYWASPLRKKKDSRCSSIAICAAFAYLHATVRAGMCHYLSGKWLRGDFDRSKSTDLSFAEIVLEIFKQSDLVIPRPAIMDDKNTDPDRKYDSEWTSVSMMGRVTFARQQSKKNN